jgi:uncharacterized protein (PEP-CTERM system associated)
VAKVGYEDLYYSGTRSGGVVTSNPYSLKSPLGSAGVRLTPNEDSQLAVAYGYIDGGESLTLNAHYKPTARTVLYASSSSALTTDSQQIQDFANNSQIVPGGITIDPRTGAPVQYISTGSQATRNRLYRQTTTSLSAALLLDRDTLNASLIVQKQEDPPGAKVVQSVASNSVYGSLGWGHDVSESVSTSLNVRYGVQKSAVTGTSSGKSLPNFQASAGLRKIFSEKLVGTADYSYIRRDSNSSTQRTTVNEFLLGLQQRF